jgi:hypothetical protein
MPRLYGRILTLGGDYCNVRRVLAVPSGRAYRKPRGLETWHRHASMAHSAAAQQNVQRKPECLHGNGYNHGNLSPSWLHVILTKEVNESAIQRSCSPRWFAAQGEEAQMETGEITFIKCPHGDSFPVRKTASVSSGSQHVICPRCGHEFNVTLSRSVERLSQDKVKPLPELELVRHAG